MEVSANGLQTRIFSNRKRLKAGSLAWAGRQSPGIRYYWPQLLEIKATFRS